MTRRLSLKDRLEVLPSEIGLALVPLLQRLPDSALLPISNALGALAFRIWGRVKNVAMENLKHAFPEHTPAENLEITRRSLKNWTYFVFQTLKIPLISDQEWEKKIRVDGEEHILKALDRGKGVIVCSGHIGCMELGPACSARRGVPSTVIARYAKTERVTQRMNEIRESAGFKVLCYDGRGFRAMRHLNNNELVYLLIDQDAGRHGIFVDFFGRPASTIPGPVVMAARSGAALIPAFVVMDSPGRFRLIVKPEVPNPGRDASSEEIRATTQELTRRLEEVVREFPDQWLWMHRRWKTQPTPQS